MPQFDFATFFPQIFWLLICFGVLYFFASRIILPRISSIIHARDGRINRNLNTAEKLQVKIDKLQIKSDKLRKKSTKIYNQTIQQTLAEASANREVALAKVKTDVEKMTAHAEKTIQNFIEDSKSQYQGAAQNVADILVKKIFGQDAKFDKEIVVPINKIKG